MRPVAATIVARNYFALARTLCASFLAHHPDGRFLVLLVEEPDAEPLPADPGLEIVRLRDLGFSGEELHLYQYSILELSTSLKPVFLRHLLREKAVDGVLYLDPDVYVAAPLATVFEALREASILVTPHMLAPFPDDGHRPDEINILQSGVYNLGFLGLRDDAAAGALLDWWAERLATRCVIDKANGLFTDQRWMDLAPAYFDGVRILKDPTLNVAYWNLHERSLARAGERYTVAGRPLTFFHFSGFDATEPTRLSKHQTRFAPGDNPALTALMRDYSEAVLANGHRDFSLAALPFAGLSNGVGLGPYSQFAIRASLKSGVVPPSPRRDPDGFCAFLMTPNRHIEPRGIAPILVALDHLYPKLAASFPRAFRSAYHARDILSWCDSPEGEAAGVADIFRRFGDRLLNLGVTARALECWRRRDDLRGVFPRAFSTGPDADAFAAWIERHGTREEGFQPGDGDRFLAARDGLLRPLMLYFLHPEVQRQHRFLFLQDVRERFVVWLHDEALTRALVTSDDIAWFDGYVEANTETIAEIEFGYSAALHADLDGGGTVFDLSGVRQLLDDVSFDASLDRLAALYLGPRGWNPGAQAEHHYWSRPDLQKRLPGLFEGAGDVDAFVDALVAALPGPAVAATGVGGLVRRIGGARRHRKSSTARGLAGDPSRNHVRRALRRAFSEPEDGAGVNLVGYFHSPTGMGEAARSMARTLQAGPISCAEIPLPTVILGPWVTLEDLEAGKLLGGHDPSNRVNIVVVNREEYPSVRTLLPRGLWEGRRNIGCWVWETEEMPARVPRTAGLDEIWAPSEYTAAAIRGAVDCPVMVVPYVPDFAAIDRSAPDRARFGIPDEPTVFGYFFDCKSILERKNVGGLLQAFRQAFGGDTRSALLVLKVNDPGVASTEIEALRRAAGDLNVLWVTDVMSRDATCDLMRSLDVYVSLHRSEGFGLTLAEAMAMGKAVVASNYSGNVDFMTPEDSCLVDARVISTDRAYGPYPAGTRWGDPDTAQAAAYLRSLMDADVRRRFGAAARRNIRERLAPERAAKLVQRRLDLTAPVAS